MRTTSTLNLSKVWEQFNGELENASRSVRFLLDIRLALGSSVRHQHPRCHYFLIWTKANVQNGENYANK